MGLLLLAAVLSGCTKAMDPKLEAVQGHWTDINSDATLDIEKNVIHFASGNWKQDYPFAVAAYSYGTKLEPLPGKDFGPMSELSVEADGSLTAYEMVLDAEGHRYHFVREDDKDARLQIRDLSEDRPKQIESEEIREFLLSFYVDYPGEYGLDDDWPCGHYSWTVELPAYGTRQMEFNIYGDSYIILRFSEEVNEDWTKGLAKALTDCGAAAQNGYHKRNEEDRHSWSLWVKYESGETLSVRAEGAAAEEMPFDLAALLEYARTQDLKPDW